MDGMEEARVAGRMPKEVAWHGTSHRETVIGTPSSQAVAENVAESARCHAVCSTGKPVDIGFMAKPKDKVYAGFTGNEFSKLPFAPPYPAMEAREVDEIPAGEQWQYEPKWDGFRCLAFREGNRVELQSKSGRPLTRYFPDVADALGKLPPSHFVLDGELVIPVEGILSFDELQLRLHPAASRVKKLAQEHPAKLIAFDLLVDARRKDFREEYLPPRRAALEDFFRKCDATSFLELSPCALDQDSARNWLTRAGGDMDGVMAKLRNVPYQSGNRDGMQKIKNHRSVDCVVGGFRYAEDKPHVGSLLLGLYDHAGLLHHVGFTSALADVDRAALTQKLKKLIKPPGFTGNAPGGPSRWSTRRSSEWEPLVPELVVEVTYDHFTGDRFRHGTDLIRWRPDKDPSACSLDQIRASAGKQLAVLENESARHR
jgi:ATP-dependent DNA ligase